MELYDLDERQKKIRWRAGFHTAFLLMGLVLADGILSQYRPWAEPAMGAVILLTAATAFFATVTICQGPAGGCIPIWRLAVSTSLPGWEIG